MQPVHLPVEPSYPAKDGSQIRVLPELSGGGLAHCLLPAGCTSNPISHVRVDEIWYFLHGRGEVYRKLDGKDDFTLVGGGDALTIVAGTPFQYRTIGDVPLAFVIVTMPPWRNAELDARDAAGPWTPSIREIGAN